MLTGNVDSRGQVVAGAGAEDDGDGARGGRLPGQVKGLAGSDAVVVGVGEGVAVGKSQQGRGHEGNEGLGRETHLVVLLCCCVVLFGFREEDSMQAKGGSDRCRKSWTKRKEDNYTAEASPYIFLK